MRSTTARMSALPALVCAALFGCGTGASGPGTMNVHLVDGPDRSYDDVTLEVRKLEIHGPGGWETLADFSKAPRFVHLLELHDGIEENLVSGKSLPAGHYDQMRMLLGTGNSVTPSGQSAVTLKVPSGIQSGLKFPVSFDVAPNTTRDVFIDFDAHRSIFVHEAGSSGKYLLRPVVRAVDRLVSLGAISGKLTAAAPTALADGAPLAGVTVMAETFEGDHPVIVRSAVTTDTGDYVLNLLPANVPVRVVAQPVITASAGGVTTTTVYAPKASDPIVVSEAAPTHAWSAAFDAVPSSQVGTVTGDIAPAIAEGDLDRSDTVVVEGSFSGTLLIVRTVPASVTSAGETYVVTDLPTFVGGYTLAVERGTTDAAGFTTVQWRQATGTPVLDVGALGPSARWDLDAP